ncbi:hypothetical protein Pdw03_8942 [Penicillium digitatum]|uniref:Uncharacterized protein n=1 Tax=Penicillium digitatum TaxID=36651 RepID=A0A7T6XPV2_PENDI|nr:hypothetical protein Pdw03_8942 [Penicillium digitatum]
MEEAVLEALNSFKNWGANTLAVVKILVLSSSLFRFSRESQASWAAHTEVAILMSTEKTNFLFIEVIGLILSSGSSGDREKP